MSAASKHSHVGGALHASCYLLSPLLEKLWNTVLCLATSHAKFPWLNDLTVNVAQ